MARILDCFLKMKKAYNKSGNSIQKVFLDSGIDNMHKQGGRFVNGLCVHDATILVGIVHSK